MNLISFHISKIVSALKSVYSLGNLVWLNSYCLNTTKLCCFVIVFTLCAIPKSYAQDLHYTQYINAPLNLNPATTFNDADFRFVFNNRSQWKAVTVPYKTFSVSADMKAFGIGQFQPNTAFGILINNDVAGDSKLHTTNITGSFAYQFAFDKKATNYLTAGIQFGYTQKSFDITDLTFNNQFTGDVFDPSAPTGEPVTNDKMSYFDLGFGVNGQWTPSEELQFNLEGAVQHINKPNNSFYSAGEVKISPHYIANAGARYQLKDNLQLLPNVLFMQQNATAEFDVNANLKYQLADFKLPITNLYGGAGVRVKDAISLNVGADIKNLFVGVSYDINTSPLRTASKGRGAIEFAVIYKIFKIRPLPPSPPCIIY
jgi:type IX secretion system PorP/SprF family membrane protein